MSVKELISQVKTLKSNLGKSWIGDDHIIDKIKDIEGEIERRKRIKG